MMETVTNFVGDHPMIALSIAASVVGIPWGNTKMRQVGPNLHSVSGKTGALAWVVGIVYLVNNWPTVSRIVRWGLCAILAVTAAYVWISYPGRVTGFILFGGIAGGLVWWYQWLGGADPTLANCRRARRMHDTTTVVRQSLAAVTPEGSPPRTGHVTEEDGRIAVHVEPAPGETLSAIEEAALNGAIGNAARQIGEKYGLDLAVTGSVVRPDGDAEGEAALICHTGGDPLARVFAPPAEWTTEPDAPVVIGVDEMGEEATIGIAAEFSLLIGGFKGAGKSMLFAGVIDQVARRTDTALVLCDPKRQEFAPWAGRASMIGVDIAGTDLALRLVYMEMKSRSRRYQADISADGEIIGDYIRKPSVAECPRIVLGVDEVAEVSSKKPKFAPAPKTNRDGEEIWPDPLEGDLITAALNKHYSVKTWPEAATESAQEILRKIITLGRSLNITTIIATQRPSTEVLPSAIRDNCDVQLGFALRDSTATEMVFGDGKVPCHKIPISSKGVGYVRTQEERQPRKFRSYLIDDERVLATAKATRDLRVDLGWPRLVEGPTPPPMSEED